MTIIDRSNKNHVVCPRCGAPWIQNSYIQCGSYNEIISWGTINYCIRALSSSHYQNYMLSLILRKDDEIYDVSWYADEIKINIGIFNKKLHEINWKFSDENELITIPIIDHKTITFEKIKNLLVFL